MKCFSVLLLVSYPHIYPIIVSLTKHESVAKEAGEEVVDNEFGIVLGLWGGRIPSQSAEWSRMET